MVFLFILSVISTIILILSVTLALGSRQKRLTTLCTVLTLLMFLTAAGLYFLSEVVEEYTVATGKILRHLIWVCYLIT